MINVSPIDTWSLAHAATGALAGALGVPLYLYGAGVVAYELIESTAPNLPTDLPSSERNGRNSIVNVATDMGIGLAAYGIALFLTRGTK